MSEPLLPTTTWSRTTQQGNTATIDQQNKVFADALANKQITQAQYDEAMRVQNQKKASADASNTSIPKAKATSDFVNSQNYYTSIGYPEYGGQYAVPTVPEGYQVTKVEKDQATNSLKFTLAPYESPALKQAKQMTEQRELANLRSNAQQGTRSGVTGVLSLPSVTANLSSADKAAYAQWKEERDRGRIVDLSTFLIAGALIPVVGAGTAVKAATIGIGVAQGVKSGMTVYSGGDISQSLLTPHEAMQAAEFGVIFGGADKLANVALAKYGGQTGAKIAGTASTVTAAEKVGVGASRIGLETMEGTAIISGIQAAETGKLSVEDVAMNAGFSLGFAVAGGATRYVGSKVSLPSGKSIVSKLTPERSRESALYDRAVLQANTSTNVGSKSWLNDLTAKTSTNPTERALYDRVIKQANESPALPSVTGNKASDLVGKSLLDDFGAKVTGKGDMLDLYSRAVKQPNAKAKATKATKGGKGSIISASDLEITSRSSPSNWVSQSLIVKPKTRTRQRMKPFGSMSLDTKMFEVSGLPIRDFTKAGVAKLKPKVEVIEKPAVVLDQVGVKALSEAKLKAKAPKETSVIEWQGMGKMESPFKFKGRSYYRQRSQVDDDVSYPATMPPEFGKGGSTAHLTIARLDLNPLKDLGLGEVQRIRSRDIQRFDQTSNQRFDLIQDMGQIGLVTQDIGLVEIQEQAYKQILDQYQQPKTKQKLTSMLDMPDFEIGQFNTLGTGRRGAKRGSTLYPIITGADFLKSFLNKPNQSNKRRVKK